MPEENKPKQEPKKGFPRSFFLFLMIAILIVATVQNFSGGRQAEIAFSYQLEPLVNLSLIIPEDSKKIALNDKLVTFSGKFRESKTDEGKERFKFLELLSVSYEMRSEKENFSEDLDNLQKSVREAAEWFLFVSGQAITKNGLRVVNELYDTPEKINSIVITKTPEKVGVNLLDLKERFAQLKKAPNTEAMKTFGSELTELLRNFRSPVLGIGNEEMKKNLRDLSEQNLKMNKDTSISIAQRLKVYGSTIDVLSTIVAKLSETRDNVSLSHLRSVRDYVEKLNRFDQATLSLEHNQVQLDKARQPVAGVIWFFNNHEYSTRTLQKQDPELFAHWFSIAKDEWDSFSANKGLIFKAPDQPSNLVLEKTFTSEEPAPNYLNIVFTVLPILLIGLLLYFVFFRQMKGVGNNAMSFGKSPARLWNQDNNKITFKDVAGIDEAKEELEEVVEFLKSPGKFTALGGRIPRGILCIGPPGTGKTLIAKAVAGEANRPFFSISGSDFVEMFVGVGASRIRDMFEQAKKQAPSIVFIDEIDAVGRHRGAGIGGGHDEREQTLNQLLVEMDGFEGNEGVILMAATNRPDVLDKALLRPGRFDRRITIDLPDIKGRYEILKVHARKIKLDNDVDLMAIARSTPGSSGADLMNLLNEAALLAARKGRSAVTAQETSEACDKVRYGKERRSLEIGEEEKKTTAYHESGHAVVALLLEHADPVEKVTIIPRGFSLGATHFVPKKNKLSYWRNELLDQLAVLMGGRIAEEVFISDVSSGAQQDIKQATSLARNMVCRWGMSENLGCVTYATEDDSGHGGMMGHSVKSYSDETAKAIDTEVREMIDAAYQRAKALIELHRDKVELMTDMLVEFETLDHEDVKHIIEGTWSVDAKKERLNKADELHKKKPVPPPPPPLENTSEGEEGVLPPDVVGPTPSVSRKRMDIS